VDIPGTSTEFGQRVRVDRWNQQAWPPLTFGVPEGWSDVPADQFAFLPAERRIPPDAPVLQDTRIVAALQRPSDRGQSWHVQLRLFGGQTLGRFVLDDLCGGLRGAACWANSPGNQNCSESVAAQEFV
jgi:hypothetical protein